MKRRTFAFCFSTSLLLPALLLVIFPAGQNRKSDTTLKLAVHPSTAASPASHPATGVSLSHEDVVPHRAGGAPGRSLLPAPRRAARPLNLCMSTTKRLDAKINRIRQGCATARDFIIADAKDADMAFGITAPGQDRVGGRWKSLADYRLKNVAVSQNSRAFRRCLKAFSCPNH